MSGKGYHFVASAHKDGNSTRICTFFDDEHLIASCAERNLSYNASLAQLLFGEVFKAGYDSPMGRNGNELRRKEKMRFQSNYRSNYKPRFLGLQPISQRAIRSASTNGWPHHQNPIDRWPNSRQYPSLAWSCPKTSLSRTPWVSYIPPHWWYQACASSWGEGARTGMSGWLDARLWLYVAFGGVTCPCRWGHREWVWCLQAIRPLCRRLWSCRTGRRVAQDQRLLALLLLQFVRTVGVLSIHCK